MTNAAGLNPEQEKNIVPGQADVSFCTFYLFSHSVGLSIFLVELGIFLLLLPLPFSLHGL